MAGLKPAQPSNGIVEDFLQVSMMIADPAVCDVRIA